MFGYVLMEYLCKSLNIKVNRLGINDPIVNNTFSLVGSICHICDKKAKNKKITIIGCGIISNTKKTWNNKYIVWKGVRGPETLKLVNKKCPVISDPGLLISNIFPIQRNPTKKIGYIIHSVDQDKFFKLFPEKKQYHINNYSNFIEFTTQLSEYSSVISSSLHGVIFCHSYSIPVCSIKVTNNVTGGNFKFIDYYRSIGNNSYKGRHEININTNFESLVNHEWQPDEDHLNNLKNNQENLIITSIKETLSDTI